MSDLLDDFFGNKKKEIQQATSNEKALNSQISNLKQESSASQTNTAKIQSLTEQQKKLHEEIQKLKEDLIISKSKSVAQVPEEKVPTDVSSSESPVVEKASPSKKSSKKLKEVSSSTPEDNTEN